MTDYELLELAAKAAGKTNWQPNTKAWYGGCDSEGVPYWNPLRDDGDAFRLAVKLGISIKHFPKNQYVIVKSTFGIGYKDDPYAATRRAIVRAAAEIGRSLK